MQTKTRILILGAGLLALLASAALLPWQNPVRAQLLVAQYCVPPQGDNPAYQRFYCRDGG
jgi:hypothetical protein